MYGRSSPHDGSAASERASSALETAKSSAPSDAAALPDDYLNHVAHQLRASLNTILGWAELLRTRDFDEAGRVRAAETIFRHARQQLWLISDLMDTWRVMSGALQLNTSMVELPGLVESAAQVVEPVAVAKNVTLNLDLARLDGRLQGDAQRLKQTFVTLLWNAIHFMTNAGVVDVRLAPSGGGAEVTIFDRGLGVSAEALPYLFDRQRPKGTPAASRRGDFGVGLSLAREIIDRHGGSIRVDSDGQCGVTFTVFLPLEKTPRNPLQDTGPVAASVPDHPMRSRLLGLTVLLVDDEPDAREVVAGILKHYGAAVVPAACVSDALAALSQERVDVLLTDIAMPGEDGFDLLRRVRKLEGGCTVPVAALTAFSSDDDRRRALEAGFQVHLSKPIEPHLLVEAVETLGKRTGV